MFQKRRERKLHRLRAELVRMELLPASSFTRFGQYITFHGIDEKPAEIAKQKAEIAYYEALWGLGPQGKEL